ncbi:MAG: FHA domain-containing protein [Chloroflexaceae bacterium]|nr:FHA domain-containing protein [Chloroflexaceae bacterium]
MTNGQEITLPTDKEIIVVGREDPVSQIFPEVDLTPHGGETGGVSRQHAQINHQNDLWSITDLNSTNYTRVDGNRIQPNTPTAIHSGTRLQFGKVEVIFYT